MTTTQNPEQWMNDLSAANAKADAAHQAMLDAGRDEPTFECPSCGWITTEGTAHDHAADYDTSQEEYEAEPLCAAIDADECRTARERAAAGITDTIAPCVVHDEGVAEADMDADEMRRMSQDPTYFVTARNFDAYDEWCRRNVANGYEEVAG